MQIQMKNHDENHLGICETRKEDNYNHNSFIFLEILISINKTLEKSEMNH